MGNKKIKILSTILMYVVILVFSYMYAHIEKMNLLYDKNIDTSQYSSTGIVGKTMIQQTFLCNEQSLDGITIKCQLSADVRDLKLQYALLEKDSDKIVAEGEISGDALKNNQFNKLYFEKSAKDCKNKWYTLNLQALKAESDKGVGFYYVDESDEGMRFIVGEEEKEGTLIVKTITKRFDLETFIVVVGFLVFIWGFLKVLYKLFK